MPIIWINFPYGSSPAVAAFHGKPRALKRFVARLVTKANPKASLIDLYFEVGAERACAVVKDLDNYVEVKAVSNVLGADGVKKFLNAAQAEEAIKHESKLT
jgi:hypothetical protein